MKVVVAGATGFIGRALVSALVERGDEVTALTRGVEKARTVLGPRAQVLEWSPPHTGAWVQAVNGADAVVNLAGEPIAPTRFTEIPTKRWTAQTKDRIWASRTESTHALVEAIGAAQLRPRVLINQSAIGYYGSQGDRALTESSPPGQDFLASLVVDWEAAARPVEEMGVRLVVMRTGIVLGQGGGVLDLMVLPFKLFGGGTMGNPGQWVSWIHMEDEIGLILYAVENEKVRGPINATAPQSVTMKEFSRQLGRALHRPSWVPMIGLGMKLVLGEQAQFVLGSQRVVPQAAESYGYRFRHPDTAEALRSLLSR